ncbi:ParB/RepB/Spo0J family partition protein [Blastococcus sp. Marseille-P5729]|uniref:ParB/RepB/Spo0J family partition protein n=1 Tax=Blastococcus sp. Marseille-P5729 TaxID=2086582 RepID=UPI001F180981|nr:ParB/RepB/Spo0J family partition protein [Blastococcus sp. Marseille-P5729]
MDSEGRVAGHGARSSSDADPSASGADPSADAADGTPNRADPADVSRETPDEAAAVLLELDPDEIRANPKNPRQVFDDDELAELAESIKEFGLLQPIVVRSTADGYELIMGERRLRAARLAGVDRLPVIVRKTEDDEMLRDALLENIHRVQLHPLEEAAAYQQLIDEFGVTHEELAVRIKRSRPAISNTIRLLKLPTRVQNRVAAGVISGSHARALLSLDDPEAQEALAARIVAEGMSVRATEEAVSLHGSDQAPTRRAARRKTVTAPALSSLAERLSDHFDTRALVQLGRTKGKIVVEFASIDDLERIIAMMAPPLATNPGSLGGDAPRSPQPGSSD